MTRTFIAITVLALAIGVPVQTGAHESTVAPAEDQ